MGDSHLSGVRVIEGSLSATGLRVGVVVSRFNSFITERLLSGALDTLIRSGADPRDITVVRTPGAYELPAVVGQVLSTGQYDCIIALGCLIKGDTIHFDLIASEVTKGLSQAGLAFSVPVTFGVLTTDTLEQAINRAGAKAGNKGCEAALAAIEQARLFQAIAATGEPPLEGELVTTSQGAG